MLHLDRASPREITEQSATLARWRAANGRPACQGLRSAFNIMAQDEENAPYGVERGAGS